LLDLKEKWLLQKKKIKAVSEYNYLRELSPANFDRTGKKAYTLYEKLLHLMYNILHSKKATCLAVSKHIHKLRFYLKNLQY
jgi:fructose-1,6-bisphosphatase